MTEAYIKQRMQISLTEDDLDVLRATAGAWTGRVLSAEEEVDRFRSGRRLESAE